MAISGVIFSALYITSLVLIRLAVPADPTEPGAWLADPDFRNWVRLALNLVPFTGIAFLWFMAVLRNRIGLLEDRFFATVFLGSGLLFVPMLFAAVAVAGGMLDTFGTVTALPGESEAYRVGRGMAYALMNSFGMRIGCGIHVRDLFDRAPHGGPLTLGIVRRLCVWLGVTPGHH